MKYSIKAICYDKRGRIISIGTNSYSKTHPIQAYFAKKTKEDYKIYLHAEIDAILKAKGKNIHKIHVIRFDKNGNQALAAPCKTCMEAIKAFGVKEISYTL